MRHSLGTLTALLVSTMLLGGCSSSLVLVASPESQEKGPVEEVMLERFQTVGAEQTGETWCWAASCQMVHAYHGRRVPQQEIVERIKGRESALHPDEMAAGTLREIMLALYPEREWDAIKHAGKELADRGGVSKISLDEEQMIRAQLTPYTTSSDELIDSLQSGEPLIAMFRGAEDDPIGHAVVLIGASFVRRPGSPMDILKHLPVPGVSRVPAPVKYELVSVTVFDPALVIGVDDPISGEKFKADLYAMVSQRIAEEALRAELESITAE
ncbi:MAG TPA: hypothetical protein DEB06_04380 [Phycisphaerales bacterium]|nr:hypothetical protein [Phycisphaerales bacterium]